MAFIIDRKYQYILAADANGTGFSEPPMSGVLDGDLLIMMWAINDDDVLSIDDGGWTEVPNTNPTASTDEVRAYYKFATSDNEQCSTWSNTATNTNVYMHTICIRGVDVASPIVDSDFSKYTSSSNTIVHYPTLTSTADKQLCFYLSSSDADAITVGSHPAFKQLEGISNVSDSMCYQYISNGVEVIPSFEDSVASDQTSAFGFILNDAVGSPAPLEVSPLSALTKITPDTNNDSGWMEAVYASGIDIDTGVARVNETPTLTVYSGTAYNFRTDGISGTLQIGETITFDGSGNTGVLERQVGSSSNWYITLSQMTGTTEPDNATFIGGTSGATGRIKGTGNYQINITGLIMAEVKIATYFCFKSNGYSTIGLTDGNVYWIKATSLANTFNEGYGYECTTHASRYDLGTTVTPSVGSATGTMGPYNMCNFSYNIDADNDYPTGSTGITGWKKSLAGSCRSYTTSSDMSNELIALWQKPASSNVAYMYFLMIDTSNNWKLWKIRSKYVAGYIYSASTHNLISPDSVDTPIFQTSSFNSNAIKYYGMMFRLSSDTARNGSSTYDQYIINKQTIYGGGSSKQVSWSDISSAINSEVNDNGLVYDKTLQNIVPSQFVLSRDLVLSCNIAMNNQALSFPPQADGINDFFFNVDAGTTGLETINASGNINTSLVASDKGAYLTNTSGDTIDYTGTIFSKYNPTLQDGKTYDSVTFVECGQILQGTATLNNCTISSSTDLVGAVLLGGTITGGSIINNDYGIEIVAAGDYTLSGLTMSGNTKDINVTAATGTVNITVDFTAPTYQTAGATVNIIAPTPTFGFTVSPSIVGYEWRIYNVDGVGSLKGSVEQDGEESAVADNQAYTHDGSAQVIAVQILSQPTHDYEEKVSYYTLDGTDQNVTINLDKDNNN